MKLEARRCVNESEVTTLRVLFCCAFSDIGLGTTSLDHFKTHNFLTAFLYQAQYLHIMQ